MRRGVLGLFFKPIYIVLLENDVWCYIASLTGISILVGAVESALISLHSSLFSHSPSEITPRLLSTPDSDRQVLRATAVACTTPMSIRLWFEFRGAHFVTPT